MAKSVQIPFNNFLSRLKAFGFDPKCFAIDKDQAEISAVTALWPDAALLLACTSSKHEA